MSLPISGRIRPSGRFGPKARSGFEILSIQERPTVAAFESQRALIEELGGREALPDYFAFNTTPAPS